MAPAETQGEVTGSFCSRVFPNVWSKFVQSLTESLHSKTMTVSDGGSDATVYHFVKEKGTERPATFLPKAEKIVAIGDVHGDMMKARRAFKLAGLVDDDDRWIGGKTVVVQLGDILDRGDN